MDRIPLSFPGFTGYLSAVSGMAAQAWHLMDDHHFFCGTVITTDSSLVFNPNPASEWMNAHSDYIISVVIGWYG